MTHDPSKSLGERLFDAWYAGPVQKPLWSDYGPDRQTQWETAAVTFTATLSDAPQGEEFLEFKEALSDLRSLRHEYECLNGGGPGWAARNAAAWAKVDELFANEDEAAWVRQQEDAHR